MNLRFFTTCDKNGVWSPKILQIWNEKEKVWEDVQLISCKDYEEEIYLHKEPW